MAIDDPPQLDELTREQALGIEGLRDVAAALSCMCGCHTRRFGRPTHVRADGTSPYDPGGPMADSEPLHDDGASCPCQQTPEERKAAWEAMREALADMHEDPSARFARKADERDLQLAQQAAAELGIEDFVRRAMACPLIVEGRHDGRAVFLRERHGSWRLELDGEVVARGADEQLDGDEGWAADHVAGRAHLCGPMQRTVRVIAEMIDRHDRGRGCTHPRAERFCPSCGAWAGPGD